MTMTVYSTTIFSTPGDFNGNSQMTVTDEVFNSGSFVSEAEAPHVGFEVKTNTGKPKVVTDALDLEESDLVTISGIPMTVKQARDAGFGDYLNRTVEKSATEVGRYIEKGELPPVEQEQPSQPSEFDRAVEEGLSSHEENLAASTVADMMEFHAALPADQTAELAADLLAGEIGPHDPLWADMREKGIGQEAFREAVGNVAKIGQRAAMADLGADKFKELDRWASESATIKKMVVQHGIKRAQGKAKLSWGDVYELARQHRSK